MSVLCHRGCGQQINRDPVYVGNSKWIVAEEPDDAPQGHVHDPEPDRTIVNQPIGGALPEPDENGWHKEEVWLTSGDGCGDDQIGIAYEARYWKRLSDRPHEAYHTRLAGTLACRRCKSVSFEGDDCPTYLVVTETYFVEVIKTSNLPDPDQDAFGIVGQYGFTECTDLEDPGGTEVWADYQYDNEVDVFFHYDLLKAEEICRQRAMSDQRFTLIWNGETK